VTHLEKCATIGKVRQTWKEGINLVKCGILEEVNPTCKSAAQIQKCGTLGKVNRSCKSAAQLKKCITLGKMEPNIFCFWNYFILFVMHSKLVYKKILKRLKKYETTQNMILLKKCGTLGKMLHTSSHI